jgi:predicted ferric reductase
MKRALSALALTFLYLLIGVAPLSLMIVGTQPRPRPLLVELSVALGFVGLSMLGLQFALVARFRSMAAPFGIDVLQRFHKEISFISLAFILAHPILLVTQNAARYLPALVIVTAPWRARFGVISLLLLLLLVSLSVWRRRLRIPYELWQLSHGGLALAVVSSALAHIDGVGFYTRGVFRQALFDVMAASLVSTVVWARIISPLLQLRRPWRVVRLQPERARSTTLVIEPEGHDGFSFKPGQFAWVSRWPVAIAQHPFSFSSPTAMEVNGRLTVTVKALGDWTRNIKALAPGRRVYLDGPHGEFSIDLHQAPGYVFVAGGVGITPLYSMISTMCVREDVRPAILFYVNIDWDSVIFREQLEELTLYMSNLRVVYVLRRPSAGWLGEAGRITAHMLHRHLPKNQYLSYEYFVCGPAPLMDTTEDALSLLGVPPERIHSERFAMV